MASKFGYVAIVGKPNVGKSSLINAIIGEKVCITTPKPQTTRNIINGIYNRDGVQMVLVDTPGVQNTQSELGQYMKKATNIGSSDTDVILVMLSATNITDTDYKIIEGFKDSKVPVYVVVNKMDIAKDPYLASKVVKLNEYGSFVKEFFYISALQHKKLDKLVETIISELPEGEPMFPTDIYTDKPVKFLAAEIIREKALLFLQDEIPHGVAIELQNYMEGESRTRIDADIICSSDRHKKIIIGKEGSMLTKIGKAARLELEKMLNQDVVLKLFVKVRENWKDDKYTLSSLGYGDETL